MTLEEAISYLKELSRQPWLQPFKHFLDAIKLGIEAIIFRQRWEDQEGEDNFPLLPGETHD